MQKFYTEQPWQRITALASSSGKAYVAVPFIGKDAKTLLPLGSGSVLVTRFDKNTIRQGGVCPATISQFIQEGVKVYQCDDLHAKVFVFRHRALVGSTNCSLHSANNLKEACLETDDRDIIEQAKEYVQSMAVSEISNEYAQEMEKFYHPPRFPSLAPPEPTDGTKFWLVPQEYGETSKAEDMALKRANSIAVQLLRDKPTFRSDTCIVSLEASEKMSIGDEVLQYVTGDGETDVYPIGRVLHISQVEGGRSKEAVVTVEWKKGLRIKKQSAFEKAIGRNVEWARFNKPREIKTAELIRAIRSAWTA